MAPARCSWPCADPTSTPSFLDISGQAEPTLGDHTRTVWAAFGGDEAAVRAVNPLDELRTARFPRSAGVLAVGRGDSDYRRQAQQIATATRAAGMTIGLLEFDGGHSWALASAALDRALPWLAGRGGILDPATARLPS